MDIRSILVSYEIDSYSPALTRCAVRLAQRLGANLIGIASAEPGTMLAAPEAGMVSGTWYMREREEIEGWLRKVEQEVRADVPADMPLDWRSYLDFPNRAVAANAVGADLILAAGQSEDQRSGRLRCLDIGDLILAAGRPVIVTGADDDDIKGQSILIGWKDTREARRSVADALPLLRQAKTVTIATVHEGDHSAESASLADLIAWLGRHGVAAKGDVHPLADSPAATLQALAEAVQADLVVTGAYGHSRLREWLLGGVTRELLARPTRSRFMSN